MYRFMIEQFEVDHAVVELQGGGFCNVPRVLLPPDSRIGDILVISKDELVWEECYSRLYDKMERLKRK